MPQMQADRHWKKNCPNGSPGCSPKSTSGGKSTGSNQQKKCDPPKNKKYHCALHKDTRGKGGYSWSCTALKYTPFDELLKLLRANGDCERCCGDCPKGNCQSKFKHTFGGGKEGRGCGSNHWPQIVLSERKTMIFHSVRNRSKNRR